MDIATITSISQKRKQLQQYGEMKGKRTGSKTHGSLLCSQRISNWKEVKQALLTTSEYGELNVIACENNS